MGRYLVTGSCRGVTRTWSVEAAMSSEAVRNAREVARADGLGRIIVRSVEGEDLLPHLATTDLPLAGIAGDDPIRIDNRIAERLMASRGPALTVDQLNAAIEDILGKDMPLQAVERDGHIFLEDGETPAVSGDDLPRKELVILCYEWLIFVGATSEDFKDFLD